MIPDPAPRTCDPTRPDPERVLAPRTYDSGANAADRTPAYAAGQPAGTRTSPVARSAPAPAPVPAPAHFPRQGVGQPRHRAARERVGGVLAAADCAGAVAGAAVAVPRGVLAGCVVAGCLLLTQHRAGLYRPGFAPGAFAELPGLAWRTVLAWGLLAAVAGPWAPGWAALPVAVVLTAAVACGLRAAVYGTRRRMARRRPSSTLVVGADAASAARIAAVLHARREYGMRPVGLAAPAPVRPAPPEPPEPPTLHIAASKTAPPVPPPVLPVLPSPGDVTRAVVQNAVRDAVVAGPAALDARTTATVRLLAAQGCRLWQVDGDRRGKSGGTGHLWGHPCRRLEPYPPTASRTALGGKRLLDAAGAGAALLCLTPVLAACALAVRLADGPGVIFRQERIGLHGRPFTLLKFRTLRPADDHESATRWSVADDRRMSRAGRLLRRTSLDELPQLWNVLRGDMSLVGPRPERPYFVTQFSQTLPGYTDRHRMPAGITGLAQVHGLRGDTSIADRARFDNHYIDSWTLWQDVSILLRTAATLFRCGGS
ncbi:exopolysaccharide biosynthesis polyprenyl glycosylphosphotransferase [Streptomyces cocklensis]|uniref:Exopolysaccharide biosynthesis polyprenyl glycosylphosphotransferase n=1 Tax=Actinacidiphila cocklensis TaxID=887465 RepID=A0A9W4DRY4_9ACTN|nr:sugar transferase [Actinacidiphila cocklensis]MDD1057136.1 exopolysaccharide biosynthesis polyprenyl glycosylphosphotransferase [Actinacidiphila cocklensis]CAG6395129.1 Exopolysaccharide biosynthesis polyprenyl glycosylphosphotransferase [Actinacidiphila cocklensis]